MKILISLMLLLAFQENCKKIDTSANQNFEVKTKQSVEENKTAISAEPVSTPVKEKKTMSDKEELAKKVQPVDPNVSTIIRDEGSKIKTLETPFLQNGAVFLVEKFAPTRMIQIYIGVVGESAFLIGGNPEKYFEFAEKAKTNLDKSELKIAYLKNFLEVTQAGKGRFKVVESVDEIKERPNLTDKEKQKFAEFKNKFRGIIAPPKDTGNSKFILFAVKKQDLVKLEMSLMPEGKIQIKETVEEKDILIPYAI